jgi:toxin-antitoxin system PIN domain toxin
VFLVDTNLLVYAANADSPFHAKAAAWLDKQRSRPDAWFLSWPIVFEFLRVTTHARATPRPWTLEKSWSFISALLASRGLSVLVATERHSQVASVVFAEVPSLTGNLLHDAPTAILMREHGIRRICTHDTDFHRFPFLEVVDPL